MTQKPLAEKYSDVLDHVDPEKTVEVYRNLHKQCLSVRQGGIVRCHAKDGICLKDAKFVVSEKGREKVRREKKKNVHAFVRGFVCNPRETDGLLDFGWDSIFYNPYTCDFFESDGKEVEYARWVDVSAHSDRFVSQILAYNIGYRKQ